MARADAMDSDSWTCERCTLLNEGEHAGLCQACGSKRGAPPSESDEASSDSEDSDGGAGDYDMATGMDGPAEAAHTVEIHVARRKWETTESSRVRAREEALANGSAVASFDEKKAAAAQIFTSQACFRMLSEELFKIMAARSPRLGGEAEADDVHVWRLRLAGFTQDSPLGAGLAALEARHPGVGGQVELRLRFKADLFPFFPPLLEVLRPRLSGVARAALIAHPALRPSAWDPFTPAQALIERLRAFLEAHGTVDVEHPGNAPAHRCAQHGAYGDDLARLEGALAQLGALADLTPALHAPLYAAEAAQVDRQRAEAAAAWEERVTAMATLRDSAPAAPPCAAAVKGSAPEPMEDDADEDGAPAAAGEAAPGGPLAEGPADGDLPPGLMSDAEDGGAGEAEAAGRKRKAHATFWAKGTGYGHDGAAGAGEERWDPARTAAAQAAQDEAAQRLADTAASLLPHLQLGADADAASRAVRSSSLHSFLCRELRGLSLMDVGSRAAYHAALLRLCAAVGAFPGAGAHCGEVAALLAPLESQARMFLRLSAPAEGAGPAAPAATAAAVAAADPAEVEESQVPAAPLVDDFSLARLAISAAVTLRSVLPTPPTSAMPAHVAAAAPVPTSRRSTRRTVAAAAAAAPPPAPADPASETEAYCAALGPLALDCCALSGEHHYRSDARGESPSASQLRRVARESASLAALLPMTPSSSVFVRVDETTTSLWRALITGPEGTPYAGGAFVFDFYFPAAYPQGPPRVNLCTTGGGAVRFNPARHATARDASLHSCLLSLTPPSQNLYNCGKVCLSLLGTWAGGRGEGWDAAASTALQVLVSIQSLIFVPQPFFNEPGFEARMGTPEGDAQNQGYNNTIREATVRYAMLDQLRHPKPEFAAVIRRHFALRRTAILAECAGWAREAPGSALQDLVESLWEELGKLEA